MKNKPLAFIIVVLLVSWVAQYLIFSGKLPGSLLTLYMFMPALVAFLFFFLGKNPVKEQVQLFTRRTSWWSWAVAFFYPILFYLIVILLAVITGLGKFNLSFLPNLMNFPFLLSIALSIAIGLPTMFGEEYGWRGYLLPALSQNYSKLWATLIVGFVWGIWHIPSYYLVYSQIGAGDPVLLTILGILNVTFGAFAYSYLFYLSRSILPVVLMHATYDVLAQQVAFGSPAVAGLAPAIPGLLNIPWMFGVCLMIIVGAGAAVIFAKKMK